MTETTITPGIAPRMLHGRPIIPADLHGQLCGWRTRTPDEDEAGVAWCAGCGLPVRRVASNPKPTMTTTDEEITMYDLDEAPTTHPCPTWCTLPAGHGYDSLSIGSDNLCRIHLLEGREMPTRRDVASVDIEAFEEASPDGQRVLSITAPTLLVSGMLEGETFGAAQARQLAAALLDAADRLDEITGSPA